MVSLAPTTREGLDGKGLDPALVRDLKTLIRFVSVYCTGRHPQAERSQPCVRSLDVEALAGRPVQLCAACNKLLAHALVKRINCPMHPKPACKHCPQHCYHPEYRRRIREVMKFSGRRLLLTGRLDYLLHLLF